MFTFADGLMTKPQRPPKALILRDSLAWAGAGLYARQPMDPAPPRSAIDDADPRSGPRAIRFHCRAIRRSGATEIRIVTAPSAEAARKRLLAAGLEVVSIDPVGPSLLARLPSLPRPRWRLPGWPARLPRPSRRDWLVTGALLASIPVSVALAAWSLTLVTHLRSERLARDLAPRIAAETALRARAAIAPLMAGPTIGALALRLATVLPDEAGLHAMARGADGVLTIEIDTPDPDRLRPALAADPLLAGLDEVGQAPTDDGAIRVTLRGRPR